MLPLAFASWVLYGDIKSSCMMYDRRVAMKLSGGDRRDWKATWGWRICSTYNFKYKNLKIIFKFNKQYTFSFG